MMMLSVTKADDWMRVAKAVAQMGTCPRRKVGALILDYQGHILSTGYNGMPSGMSSCTKDYPCSDLDQPIGQGLDKCLAVHAEQNAMLQCSNMKNARVLITTSSPCIHCLKMLLNTPITDIVYMEMYQMYPLLLWVDSKRNHGQVEV